MRTLRVQFVRRTPVLVYLVAALAVGLFLFAGVRLWGALNVYRRTQDIQAEMASLQARVSALNGKISLTQKPPPYQVGAVQAAREAKFPIEAVLASLESVSVAGVKVTSIVVTPVDASAQAELEYQSPDALAKYLQQLAQLQMPHEWRLLKVQSENPTVGPFAQSLSTPSPIAVPPPPIVTSTATLMWGDLSAPGPVK